MTSRSQHGSARRPQAKHALGLVLLSIVMVTTASTRAWAGAVLKLGDILIAEPGTASVSVIDPATGAKTVISQGGLLAPAHKTVAVALGRDGDIIVVHRTTGLIRVNPVTGAQTLLSQGGLFKDPWAIAIDKDTGYIYVADSGYDNDRPEINEAGKIVRVDPTTGAQQLIAAGSPCTVFPANAACQNTTAAGSYLSHPYGIAIDYTIAPGSIIVADSGSFNGKGAIVRIQPVPNGSQTLLWGPSTASPPPQVSQVAPLGCPMGVAVEPNGNILTTVFTYPVPPNPVVPPPPGTFYGCAPPGIFRVDLTNNVQTSVNLNAPAWEPNRAYTAGTFVRGDVSTAGYVHVVVSAGTSQSSTPQWSGTLGGITADGSIVWQNAGHGADWLIPFGVDAEPSPTPSNPAQFNIILGDEGHSMLFRLSVDGLPSAEPLAAELNNITSVDVITFVPVGGFKTEPIRSNGQPSGALPPGTTTVTLSLNTDVNATCRYSQVAGVAFASMTSTFSSTGSTTHATQVGNLAAGSHEYFVRCMNSAGQPNSDDYSISFLIPQPPMTGPVAAYGFDEGTGGTVGDASGRGHTGTISGASWSNTGKSGKALSFDGVNDWVTVSSTSLLNFVTGMTLEAWVFPTTTTGVRDVIIKEGPSGDIYNLYARNWRGRPESNVLVGGRNRDAEGTALQANVWTHLAGTYDGNAVKLFVNGVQVRSMQAAGSIEVSNGSLRIGGNSLWGEFFQGLIDEVRLYNRALSRAEIVADMNRPVNGSASDGTPPIRLDGQPVGTLPWGTTQTVLQLTTNETASCRYSTQSGIAYASMATAFTTTGGTSHAANINGLTGGSSYTFYVRCADSVGNANTDDFPISFAVPDSSTPSSTFAGSENPLFENGLWESAGSWSRLQKNNGAFASGANAAARLVPPLSSDQYSEAIFSENPGASSWVGVMTRIQGPNNGSGYLAIAYAGEVRLYRTDDSGGLNFVLLASASVDVGASPRQLRLESQGNTHRILFNGIQRIAHTATGFGYTSGQPGIAASVFGGPTVRIISFVAGDLEPLPDTTPPVRMNPQPSGTLPAGTSQATLSLLTDESAACRYAPTPGVAFAAMPNTFATANGVNHSSAFTGLTDGGNYTVYVRCIDATGNANTDDVTIAFSVADASNPSSTFTGVEAPLSEGGRWDAPGSWAALQKSDGAFTVGLNAQARLTTPALSSDHFSEITFDQDPGAASWVGATTRVQGPANGSGYLAIAFAGEVRLYRADDSGSLTFTLLSAAPINVGAAPRRLRLESEGNVHRVFFNGSLAITHTAAEPLYATGQPGIAASVFGGPVVRILSFQGGSLD